MKNYTLTHHSTHPNKPSSPVSSVEISGQLTRVHVHESTEQLQRQLKRAKRIKDQRENGTGKRSKVKGFSRQARRRMMDFLATVDFDKLHLLMLTLTYGREFSHTPGRWKRDEQTMSKALKRRFPDIGIVWKLEPQKRGAPHFHLFLMFPKSAYPKPEDAFICRDWLALRWAEITDDTSKDHIAAGVRIERIRSYNGMMKYASKYITKDSEQLKQPAMIALWESVGRWWGRHNKAAIPIAQT